MAEQCVTEATADDVIACSGCGFAIQKGETFIVVTQKPHYPGESSNAKVLHRGACSAGGGA
jgi:hypothetical protein